MSYPGKVMSRIDAGMDIELNPLPAPNPNPNEITNPQRERETVPGLSDTRVRQRFISKVYGVVTIQLCFTLLFARGLVRLVPFFKWEDYFNTVIYSPLLLIPSYFSCCCGDVKRSSGGKYILLLVFTLVEAIFLACLFTGLKLDPMIFLVGLVAAVTLLISLFALQTKWGFTTLSGILLAFFLVLILWGLCAGFLVRFELAILWMDSSAWGSFFAFWFCSGLVCNTQRLLRNGGRANKMTPADFIYVALTIHLDMFLIFYLLSLLLFVCLYIKDLFYSLLTEENGSWNTNHTDAEAFVYI